MQIELNIFVLSIWSVRSKGDFSRSQWMEKNGHLVDGKEFPRFWLIHEQKISKNSSDIFRIESWNIDEFNL